MDKQEDSYRQHLIEARQKAYEGFDKTVFALSGGGLGISMAFIDKLLGQGPIVSSRLLYFAWISWVASLTFVLLSHYMSGRSLDRAIRQYDDTTKRAKTKRFGGVFSTLTEISNAAGGVLFVVGLTLMVTFASKNLEAVAMSRDEAPSGRQSDIESTSNELLDLETAVSEPGETAGYTPPPPPPEPEEPGHSGD